MFFESIAHAMGATPSGGGQAGATDMLVQFVPLILMFGIFWFLLIRPQQKRAKEHKAMLENLKRGDYVVTSGGMIGRILEIDADAMLLECGESKLRMTRGAIAGMYAKDAAKVEEKK
ncbi:MAG: preprotein translocase subunit YajC [Desulfovibrionaceae bacterium]